MGLLSSAMGHLTGLSGAASVMLGPEDDGAFFEHACRTAPSAGALAARIAARARNCRRVVGSGIWGLPVAFSSCRW